MVWRSGCRSAGRLEAYNGVMYPYKKAQKLAKKVLKSSILKFCILILSHLNILTQEARAFTTHPLSGDHLDVSVTC